MHRFGSRAGRVAEPSNHDVDTSWARSRGFRRPTSSRRRRHSRTATPRRCCASRIGSRRSSPTKTASRPTSPAATAPRDLVTTRTPCGTGPTHRRHASAHSPAKLDALPANAFAPFSKQTWSDYWWLDMCLGWPVPDRFEPAVPEGTVFEGIPALILAGDLDTVVSIETSRALLEGFPDATFLLVRGPATSRSGVTPAPARSRRPSSTPSMPATRRAPAHNPSSSGRSWFWGGTLSWR